MNPITALPPSVEPHSADTDERDLAARLARGEPAALDEVVERYGRRVVALARRLLGWSEGADDVAQDVFLAVWQKGRSFRGEAQLWTYLAAITVNRSRSTLRRRWLADRTLRAIAPFRAQSQAPQALGADETAQAVRAAIARLPQTYREVIVLRYLEELSVRQVAEVLGLRPNTVEVRLSRARKLLEPDLTNVIHEENVQDSTNPKRQRGRE
jgi:RNA polymerase sigma-70 factor (ECF subfamily)